MAKLVTEDGYRKLIHDNGVVHNPLSQPSQPRDLEIALAVVDALVAVRGAVANANLGNADLFVSVGEWELALDEVDAAVIQDDLRIGDSAKVYLEFARSLIGAGA